MNLGVNRILRSQLINYTRTGDTQYKNSQRWRMWQQSGPNPLHAWRDKGRRPKQCWLTHKRKILNLVSCHAVQVWKMLGCGQTLSKLNLGYFIRFIYFILCDGSNTNASWRPKDPIICLYIQSNPWYILSLQRYSQSI